MGSKKNQKRQVRVALGEIGLKDPHELFRRAYRWDQPLAQNMKIPERDFGVYTASSDVPGYVTAFIGGGFHRTFCLS